MTFRSKVDTWLALVLAGLPLVFLVQFVVGLIQGQTGLVLVGGLGTASLVALYGILVWPVAYILDPQELVIRCGLIRSRIPYQEITSVAPYRGILKGPALSSERLQVKREGKLSVEISPQNKADFLAALVEKAGGLELEGDRVVRQ